MCQYYFIAVALVTAELEVFVPNRLQDRILEEAGRRIYESQQARLSDQTSFAAKRRWRSPDVPEEFWESYCEDARAVLALCVPRQIVWVVGECGLADVQRFFIEVEPTLINADKHKYGH